MKLVTLVSNNVGVDTYLELRKAVNFKPLSRTQAKKALDNSLYIVCAYIDAKIVGMGRLVGDGAVICYIQDLMIHKHEFISRPTDKLGPGMIRYIRK